MDVYQAVRIRQSGFAARIPFGDFLGRYKIVVPKVPEVNGISLWRASMDLSNKKCLVYFFCFQDLFFVKVGFGIYNSFWRSSLCVFRSFIHRKNNPFSDSSLQHPSPTLLTLLWNSLFQHFPTVTWTKILHHQGWWLSHYYLQGFVHPNGGCLGFLPSTVTACFLLLSKVPTSSEGQAQGDLHGLWGGKGQGLCPGGLGAVETNREKPPHVGEIIIPAKNW